MSQQDRTTAVNLMTEYDRKWALQMIAGGALRMDAPDLHLIDDSATNQELLDAVAKIVIARQKRTT